MAGREHSEVQRRFLDIPSLDGLRAVSIAIVFAAHAGIPSVPGGFGVSVFFVISGYLITTLLVSELDRTGTVSLRDFYLRRAFRILPIFYVVLVLGLVASWIGLLQGDVDLDATLAQLLHYYNFYAIWNDGFAIVPGTGVYWSLAIEEHFYVLFPLFFLGMSRLFWNRRKQGYALLALCGVVLIWRIALIYGMDASPIRTYFGSDTRADGLLFGCAAALIGNPAFASRRDEAGRPQVDWAGVGVAAAATVTILVSFVIRDVGFRETFRYTIQSIAIVALLRYAIVAVGSPSFRMLNWSPVMWFGRMSYGFYLVHQVVIAGLKQRTDSFVVILVLSLVLSTLLAWGLHLIVERPTLSLRNRVIAALRQGARDRAGSAAA